MDAVTLADLRRSFESQREFTLYVGPEADTPRRSLTLRLPTQHEVRVASLRAGVRNMSDPAALALLERQLVIQCVVGWAGMRRSDLQLADGAEALDFHPGAVDLLLDAQPDWFRQPAAELFERISRRDQERDAAAGN